MEYKKIVSITGFSGLFELLSNKSDGAIVKSLEDQQTKFISSRLHTVSQIESIEVYTTEGNIRLAEMFKAMKDSTDKPPSEKDPSALKKYFQKIYPTIDLDRVYTSDMKKMVKWFQLLQTNNIDFTIEETTKEEDIVETTTEKKYKETVAKTPKKITTPKTTVAKRITQRKES